MILYFFHFHISFGDPDPFSRSQECLNKIIKAIFWIYECKSAGCLHFWYELWAIWNEGVARLVEHWAQDSMKSVTWVQTSSWVQETFVSFSKSDSLSVCPTPMCIHIHKNDHIRMLNILWSMSEFGGLRKHEKSQHAHFGLTSPALAAAVVLPR